MVLPGEQFAPPAQKWPEGRVRVLWNFTHVSMSPHFQAHEGNPDIQGSVKLKTHMESHSVICRHHLPSPSAWSSGSRFLSSTCLQGRREQVLLFKFLRRGTAWERQNVLRVALPLVAELGWLSLEKRRLRQDTELLSDMHRALSGERTSTITREPKVGLS